MRSTALRLPVLAGWCAAGTLVALAAQLSVALPAPDGWAALLRVGSENPLRGRIEAELGPLQAHGPLGHDGQISYLVASDPFNRHDTASRMRELDQAPYRYRRILYPALAGGFGLFSGRVVLLGLVALAALGAGLGVAAVEDLRRRHSLPAWITPAALVNLGAILSAVLLTSDALALGLGLLGVALADRGRLTGAVAALALAALTKEAALLFAWGAAAALWLDGSRRGAAAVALLTLAPLALWSAWIAWSAGALTPALHHLALPGTGILAAVPKWFASPSVAASAGVGASLVLLVAVSIVASVAGVTGGRARLPALCAAAWALLALVLSVNVWEVPTNALRVLAPLWPLCLLCVAVGRGDRSRYSPS